MFRQWGDALFVAIQTLIIIMQILYFNGNKWQAIVAMLITWAIGMAVTRHYIPLKVLETVQASIIPLIILSKVWFHYSLLLPLNELEIMQ